MSLWTNNRDALRASGQELFLAWLDAAADRYPAEALPAEGGGRVIRAAGQSQSSHRDPSGEARQWLAREALPAADRQVPVWLFGLGSPWALRLLLGEGGQVTVYEPSPAVSRIFLAEYDFSRELAAGDLVLLSPRHLAEELPPAGMPRLLAHPPALRREAGQWANLKLWLNGKAPLRRPAGRPVRLMIVPPISGGSRPVAEALARAAELEGLDLAYLDWGPEAARLERSAQEEAGSGSAGRKLTAALFKRTAELARRCAEARAPDVILALAQAPLDVSALEGLRQVSDAPLALWLVEDVRLFAYAAETAPAYDYFFHIQDSLARDWARSLGLRRAGYLPLAADAELFQPLDPGTPALSPYAADLSFMGAGYPNRRRLLAFLAGPAWAGSHPDRVFKVFGNGWAGVDPVLRPHLFEGGRRVSTAECALIYAAGRVHLNIHSSPHGDPAFAPESLFVNPRTFEIAAAGSCQIVDARPLMAGLFEPGRELVQAERPEDLPDLIHHHLTHFEEARAMGLAARRKVLERHQYRHRLLDMLNRIGLEECPADVSGPK